MLVTYYSVWDKKAQQFGQLFPSITPGSAERSFRDSVNNPDSMHNKYPSDFSLFSHFVFDDETGLVVDRHEPPRLVVEGSALVPSSPVDLPR